MTSDSSNSPLSIKLSQPTRRHKPHVISLKRRTPPPPSPVTLLFNDSTDPVEEPTYPIGQDTVSGPQHHHPTESDLLNGHVASNDNNNATVELKSPVPTNEHAPPISPTRHRPSVIHPSPGQDVVELISPMVVELRNSVRYSTPPTESISFGTAFTLNPDSALAMPDSPPKPIASAWSSYTASNPVQGILEPLDNLSWGTQDASSSAFQNENLPDISMADQLPTRSPGNSLAIDLSPIEALGAVPVSPPAGVEDISAMEEEELLTHTRTLTVFDPEYSKSRRPNLWAQDELVWVSEKMVIGEIWEQYVDLDNGGVSFYMREQEEEGEEEEEEETDVLNSNHSETSNHQDSEYIESPSKRRKIRHRRESRVKSEREDIQLSQRDEPAATAPRFLAHQIETWNSALHSLVKGKKRFHDRVRICYLLSCSV